MYWQQQATTTTTSSCSCCCISISCCWQMSKKIKKLEKETAMYRQRWEGSNKALLAMAEEVSDVVYTLHLCRM